MKEMEAQETSVKVHKTREEKEQRKGGILVVFFEPLRDWFYNDFANPNV